MRSIPIFALIAIGHFVLTIVLVIFTFGAGMSRFDTLDGPDWTETVASTVVNVLAFPILHLLDRQSVLRFPGLWGYVPFAANTLSWTWVIVTFWRLRGRVSGPAP